MKRRLFPTAALLTLGLCCGCATTTNPCGERQGLFSRLFGHRGQNECPCVETGRVTYSEGPVIPEPGCCGAPGVLSPGVVTPIIPTMPPPTALPNPNPLAQPIEAGPVSKVKDAGK